MNLFTTDAFLETAAEVFYPGHESHIEVFRVRGLLLRLLVVDGAPVLRAPYYDFPQPLDGPWEGPVHELAYFPRTVLATTTIDARVPEAKGFQPSPYIEWGRFPTWEDFAAHGRISTDSRRRRRKLEKALGEVRFVFDDARPEVFDACVRWKSRQYVSSSLPDLFADWRNVELFRRLRARGAVVVSSLQAGDTLLAVHLGGLADGRLYWWVPAYEHTQAIHSPGRLMLEALLEASFRQGHREFDFLIGDEGYKFHYATHNRVIGPAGVPPLGQQLRARVTDGLHHLLDAHPHMLTLARKAKRRMHW